MEQPAQQPAEEPEEPAYGGGVEYWNVRHSEAAEDGRKFDWLYEHAHLKTFLGLHVGADAAVLQLGCGNSRLAVEWCAGGHRGRLQNVDFSPVVVEQMRREVPRGFDGNVLPLYSNVSYDVADVRSLSERDFPSSSFDAVLDKATFDCISCNSTNKQADLEAMLLCAFRVLRPGGVFLLVSMGDPESRVMWLDDEPGLDWTVSVSYMLIRSKRDTDRNCRAAGDSSDGEESSSAVDKAVEEVLVSDPVLVSGNDSWEKELCEVGEDDHTFVYICRKR